MTIYSADFETTTAAYSSEFSIVWAGAFVDITKHDDDNAVNIFSDITDFMYYVENFFRNGDIIYFHNLKFDGSFIINALFEYGYEYVKGQKSLPPSKCFDAAISDMGTWYRIRISVPVAKRNGEGYCKMIEIRNSLCLVSGSVAQIGDSFGTRKRKLDIDYDAASFPHKMSTKEIEYLKADVLIIAEVLNLLINEYGFEKLTAGSNAIGDFMKRFGGKTKFKGLFPELSKEIDEFCREAYRGGISWVNPKIRGNALGNGCTYDCNSEYPGMMHGQSGNMYPYDAPVYFEGEYQQDNKYPLWIARVSIAAERKPDKMPCMQIKRTNIFKENEWLDKIHDDGEPVEITITSVDLQLLKECYDITSFEMIEGYKFKGCRGVFDKFIDHWNEIKMNSKGAKRQVAKLMMNSFYGKFGTRLFGFSKDVSYEGDKLKFTKDNGEERDAYYIPVACFVTAYGRRNLIHAGNANFDRLCYVDTDSVHLLGHDEAKGIEIHDKKLGAWKQESKWSRGKFIRQKTYVEDIIGGELDIKCAGMPDSIKYSKYIGEDGMVHKMPAISFDGFKIGARWETGKLIAKQVKGGVLLLDTPFEIKAC